MVSKELEDAKQFALKHGASKMIKQLMLKSEISVQELAKILDIKPQSFSTKLYRDRFTYQEVQMITHLLGYKMVSIKKKK
ncbi:hypothetical protein [Halobacillus salinus]|uniref:XRE family transcriptional regulator n=1 Tax=Halobacillus salinus TaxID=192814 RepID=A0A4Z0H6I3_9BACI|nr:hypothetical protein [Halobacillus salinus]TGB04705.1 hypothetical protein E4663_06865 [Halobacillus salinus]